MLKGPLLSDVSQTWNIANYNNFIPFWNNNYYNYFIKNLYLLFVRRGFSSSVFLCIHAVPDDGWYGQPKHVVVLNKPYMQDKVMFVG